MKKFLKIFFKIVGTTLLILIAIIIFWFAKNWIEAGRQIKASENYSKLLDTNAPGPITANQKLILKMQGWTQVSHWPCSIFHLKSHVSGRVNRNLVKRLDPLNQAFIACRLERSFTHSQLLSYYLKNTYVGKGEYGVEKVSQNLFGKSFENLTKEEVMQIGLIIRNPNSRNKKDRLEKELEFWVEKLDDN